MVQNEAIQVKVFEMHCSLVFSTEVWVKVNRHNVEQFVTFGL